MTPQLVVVAIVLTSVTGDYFIKLASRKSDSFLTPEFILGAALYVVTACGFLIAMRHMSLASIGVLYAVLTIVLMTALGVFVFKETLLPREIAGILMAFGAIGLMSRFT
jgi:multidrug transporter EmrE-like cation transporter